MPSDAEQRFDQVKALTERPALFDPESVATVHRGPWVRPCAAPGPYALRKPTPTQPNRLEVLSCTRPESHGGPFHQATDTRWGVLAQWSRDGKPDWPPILTQPTVTAKETR